MKLCFATNNPHKIEEVRAGLDSVIQLLTLKEAGIEEELLETQATLEGNARQKAHHVFDGYGVACFADDTGLEVDSLHGAPGVYSARFAGAQRSASDNMRLLLDKLTGKDNRNAQFRTVFHLVLPNGEWSFEGIVRGTILQEGRGSGGFGYDPIFLPDGSDRTLAEMTTEEKNRISHRGVAIRKLTEFLRTR